jgi:hypothetical protein
MPINVVKTLADEKAWRKAKAAVGSKYAGTDRHWRLVMGAFKKIRANMTKAK